MKMKTSMWPARGERTAKAKKSMGKKTAPADLGMKTGGKASDKMKAMKGKPGKFKPGAKDKPSFVRG